ncbi:MAG: response regulator [Clostridiales bacterium]|nr:response regulator [Clostridiales bacterium]
MYRVILAEDEPLVRMGIKSMVNWEELDMRVVAECSDGEEAWKAYEMYHPDLIITDLKMPVMDGMELIRKIRSVDSRVRILVLTCIEDFDYARQAIECDVSNYILKLSCTVEKFTGILSRTLEELRSMSVSDDKNRDVDFLPIRESLFFDYVCGRRLDCKSYTRAIREAFIPIPQGRISLTVMRLMEYQRFLKDDQGGRALKSMVKELVELALKKTCVWECYCGHPGEYVLLFACADDGSGLARDNGLLRISDLVDEYLNLDIRFSPENTGIGYEDLPQMYAKAQQQLTRAPEKDFPRKITAALAIIRKNFDKPISLQSVADDLNVSAGYLSRLFLSTMGRTFTDSLNQVRVERAKQLLRDRKLTAYKVGELVGIGNATYFIRVFKKYTGETPNEYRSKYC